MSLCYRLLTQRFRILCRDWSSLSLKLEVDSAKLILPILLHKLIVILQHLFMLWYNRLDHYILVGRSYSRVPPEVCPCGMSNTIASQCNLRVITDETAIRKLDEWIGTLGGQARFGREAITARFSSVVNANGTR